MFRFKLLGLCCQNWYCWDKDSKVTLSALSLERANIQGPVLYVHIEVKSAALGEL